MSQPHRPLSPHLQIYKMSLTMAMSIIHRITGVGLYLGTVLLAAWLVAAAAGPEQFALINSILGHWLGQVVLVGFTWALFHHMLGGIKHFIWDTGRGLDPEGRLRLTWFTLIGGFVLTGLVWSFLVWL